MKTIETIFESGWNPLQPSESCRVLTAQFANAVRDNRRLLEIDRVGIVRVLVLHELKVQFGKLADARGTAGEQEEQTYLQAVACHALRSLGRGRLHPDGRWNMPPEDYAPWVGELNDWDTGRWREAAARWDDVNDRDAFDEIRRDPARFEPVFTTTSLLTAFGYCDQDGDLRTMQAALKSSYPGWKGTVTLKEMPGLFDLIRRTAKGTERRVMYGKHHALHLGQEEVERGLAARFGAEIEPLALSIDRPSKVTGSACEPASPDSDFLGLFQQSRQALDALEGIRRRARPGSGMATVLEPEHLKFLADGGSFADLARRVDMDESTLRQAHARATEEVKERLTG